VCVLQVVAFVLIGVAAYAKAVAYIVDISVMGGIIACGVFLLLIASVGIVGTILHHQVTLFFVSFSMTMHQCVQWLISKVLLLNYCFDQFLLVRRSKRRLCYGNVAGWVGGCLSQPILYQND